MPISTAINTSATRSAIGRKADEFTGVALNSSLPRIVSGGVSAPIVSPSPSSFPPVAASAATVVTVSTTDPTTLPFRVVGAEVSKAKIATPAVAVQTESPVKSVFDQNVELLDSLNNLSQKKAA